MPTLAGPGRSADNARTGRSTFAARDSRSSRAAPEESDSFNVTQYIPALRAYAWTLTRRHQDVDDLVQETLTRAIGNAHRYRRGTNLRAWLMTIMRNSFLNQIVKTKRERPGDSDCISTLATSPALQEWTLRGGEMMRAIDRLPPHYRDTLVLVILLGETYETAGEVCGISMGTVKSRVNRAREMVKEELGSDYLEKA